MRSPSSPTAPGTTRDVLRQHLHLDGLPLNLIDTAGLRGAPMRSKRRACAAPEPRCGARIACCTCWMPRRSGERSAPELAAELEQLPPDVPVTLVFNKIDLTGAPAQHRRGVVAAADFPERQDRRGTRSAARALERERRISRVGDPARLPRAAAISMRCGRAQRAGAKRRRRCCDGRAPSSCSPRICASRSAPWARSPASSPARICSARFSAAFASASSRAARR